MLAAQILHRLRQLIASRRKRLGGIAAVYRALPPQERGSNRQMLWQLVPTADPTDARWRGHPVWSDVIVRAETAAEAFSVAAALLSDPGSGKGVAAPARDMFELRKLLPAERLDIGEGTILSLRLRGRQPLPSAAATGPASP